MGKSIHHLSAVCAGLLGLAVILAPGTVAGSGHDTFVGDTAIYGTNPSSVQPNVLIILDTSGSMNDEAIPAEPYDPGTTYADSSTCNGGNNSCQADTVYRCTAFGLECANWVAHVGNVGSVDTSCPFGGFNPQNALQNTGQFNALFFRLQTNGNCVFGLGQVYAVGNWINWRNQGGTSPEPKIDIAKRVVTNLISNTTGIRIGVMIFNDNQGGELLTYNGYTAEVKDMDAIFSGVTTNRQALINAVNSVTANSWTPLAETLYEGMRYYQGQSSAFNSPLNYTSPLQEACQQNYVVLVTDGMSTQDRDNVLKTFCNDGDCDADGFEPDNDPAKNYPNQGSDYLDDLAKYMFTNDMDLSGSLAGTQNVITYTVGFGLGGANAGAVKLLQETAANGGGEAFLSEDEQDLAEALTQIFGQIMQVNTSFVAPVVPVSPENKTFSGSRIYLGFFKPQANSAFWTGNLKKYGLDATGEVVDVNNLPATNPDGSFKDTSISFWSTVADGGEVDIGGTGEVLYNRVAARKIYTYTGTSFDLTHSSNAFSTTNADITFGTLGVADAVEKDKVINFVHGLDAYDKDADGNTAEKRAWILGDILHSKPRVVNYNSYSLADEADCGKNGTMIFVGANDGMLHAFRDCDGEEVWAFVPPDKLPHLQYLNSPDHTYFVDASPSVYIYDQDGDGEIEPGAPNNDRVVLVFGERRGGDYYYALDVSDPAAPVLMWKLSSTESPSGVNTDYAEMGQSWSEPIVTKIKVNGVPKVAMIIGAGYDNTNEDRRYGATQSFADSTNALTTGEGNVTSAAGPAAAAKGRGIYLVEIADLSLGAPDFSNGGHKLWDRTNANTPTLTFSIPSEVTELDKDNNGYTDRFYVGDAGGNLWKFDISDPNNTALWTATKLFSSNPGVDGAADVGRKIFYPPDLTLEPGYQLLFFGTGDRAHPLNTAVVDRMYAVKDDPTNAATILEDDPGDVAELVDVTTDELQGTNTTAAQIDAILADLENKLGWFIKLDQREGEKVLAPALAFIHVYYSTYAPDAPSVDPCEFGNLGTARLYLVNPLTGEAVYNFDQTNDGIVTSNARAQNEAGEILQRPDREATLGSGIASGFVVVISGSSPPDVKCFVSAQWCGGPGEDLRDTVPLYWRLFI